MEIILSHLMERKFADAFPFLDQFLLSTDVPESLISRENCHLT